MSKRSFGVIIIGILAIAGFGLSGYMYFKNEILIPEVPEDVEDTVIKNIWYAEQLDSIYFIPTSWTEIPNFNVTVTVNSGEFLYISFNGFAGVYLSGLETISLKFKINSLIHDNPFIQLGGSFSGNLYAPVSLQYSIQNGTAGTYTISVCAISSPDASNWLKDLTLLVYTYI